jgi:hypothetical protein
MIFAQLIERKPDDLLIYVTCPQITFKVPRHRGRLSPAVAIFPNQRCSLIQAMRFVTLGIIDEYLARQFLNN